MTALPGLFDCQVHLMISHVDDEHVSGTEGDALFRGEIFSGTDVVAYDVPVLGGHAASTTSRATRVPTWPAR